MTDYIYLSHITQFANMHAPRTRLSWPAALLLW